jgi:hypothetical protein
MARPAVGSLVIEGRRVGKVVAHRLKGMVDVDFGDEGITERRPETNLKPYDANQDAIRIHVLGVYRSLLTKELGIPLASFHSAQGRADVLALASGRLTREDIDRLVGRAHAIAIKQEQKPLRTGSKGTLVGGYLKKGTKTPTARGRLRSRERQSETAKHEQDLADYELMLELRRKGKAVAKVANPPWSSLTRAASAAIKSPTTRKMWTSVRKTATDIAKSERTQKILRTAADEATDVLAEEAGKHAAQQSKRLSDKAAEKLLNPKIPKKVALSVAERTAARKVATKVAVKAGTRVGAKAIPYVGQALMVIDAAPAFYRESKSAITEDYIPTGREAWSSARKGQYKKAISRVGAGMAENMKKAPGRIGRVGRAALLGFNNNPRTPVFKAGEYDPNLWRSTPRGLERRGKKHVEATPTRISFVEPTDDPDGKGFFVLTFDPRFSKSIRRITDMVGHWVHAPNITHRGVVTGLERSVRGGEVRVSAPERHEVIMFGRGHYGVVGPRANERDVYGSKADAEKAAKRLDIKAASFVAAATHTVSRGTDGWYVSGPAAGDEEAGTLRSGPFRDEGEAQQEALRLDRKEANRFAANPIAGMRTSPRLKNAEAVIEVVSVTNDLFAESSYPIQNETEVRASLDRWGTKMARQSRGIERAKVQPSVFHGMSYKSIREFLKGEGFEDAKIAEVIEAEKANRAMLDHQAQRQLELESRRVGTVKTKYVKRKKAE